MEDLIKSIKAHLYERTTSPLFGAFTISWGIWNYKFLVTVFSSMETHLKFDYIATFLYPNTYTCLSIGIIYPLLTTLAFIFLYPYPAKFVYSFTRLRQKELKEIKQSIEDKTPLTHEESRKLRRDMAELEIEYEKEIQRKNDENQRLKELIEELKKENNSPPINKKNVKEPPPYKLDNEQLTLLKLISTNDEPSEKNLVGWSKTNKVKTEYNLGELVNKSFITVHSSSQRGKYYIINHSGRSLLVKNGMVE